MNNNKEINTFHFPDTYWDRQGIGRERRGDLEVERNDAK